MADSSSRSLKVGVLQGLRLDLLHAEGDHLRRLAVAIGCVVLCQGNIKVLKTPGIGCVPALIGDVEVKQRTHSISEQA